MAGTGIAKAGHWGVQQYKETDYYQEVGLLCTLCLLMHLTLTLPFCFHRNKKARKMKGLPHQTKLSTSRNPLGLPSVSKRNDWNQSLTNGCLFMAILVQQA